MRWRAITPHAKFPPKTGYKRQTADSFQYKVGEIFSIGGIFLD